MFLSHLKGLLRVRNLISKEDENSHNSAKSMPSDLPLSGIRILDITGNWAGPHAARILADCGAQVIKIEYSKRLDMMRGWVKKFDAYNLMPSILQLNRNKYSITLDLREPRGVEIFKELAKISDVVIESSRVGVMEKLGLDYNALKEIRQDIIYVSMPAFGSTGPESKYCAYGATLEGVSGIQSLTAYSNGEMPVRVKELDVVNGLHGASAVMTALLYRQQTGKGQWVDVSQLEASTTGLIGEHLLALEINGYHPNPTGNRHSLFAPHGCYPCKGDDQWVTISVQTETDWEQFCETVGHTEWKVDERFCSHQDRLRNHDELDYMIEQWTSQRTHYEAMHTLQKANIAAGAVLNMEALCSDNHIKERQYIRTARNTNGDGLRFPGIPFKLSGSNGDVFWRGSRLGEDNEYVLSEILGRSKMDFKAMKNGKIGTAYDLEKK